MCQATCSETPEESATPTATNNAWWQGGQLLAVGIVLLAPTCSIAVYQAVRAALRRTIPYAVFPGPASFISSGGRYDHTNTPVLEDSPCEGGTTRSSKGSSRNGNDINPHDMVEL
eukprot:CAMPEP_0178429036 /NCGR_PEP_ID=MMETSP0689_2-20121128/30592_1 /TAXON_ID=160604 /ORGANISM="Amphidinium massartii, Strain CS-259" /LENGTH=114 /DNA_ID=CAMNT_0020050839 /DNA_START=110 /DNA_END=451 /DNA_ORIENTATION=-